MKNTLFSEFHVSLPLFEGPFSLLPLLVRKQEVEIHELSLIEILKQFLHYLDSKKQFLRTGETGSISYLSWLHQCKSAALVHDSFMETSKEEEEESYDPALSLEYMKEYSAIRIYTRTLQYLEEKHFDSSYRPPLANEEERMRPTDACSLNDLKQVLNRLLEESAEKTYLVEKESFSLTHACAEMKLLLQRGPLSFLSFCRRKELSRKSLILLFLALLELLKQGEIFLTKHKDDVLLNYGHN